MQGGTQVIKFVVPSQAVIGTSFLRLRLSSAGGLGPLGFADDGEIEDYQVEIRDGSQSPDVTVQAPENQVTVMLGDDQIVVESNQTELFSAPRTNVGSLRIPGSDQDDVVTLDLGSDSVAPDGGLEIDAAEGNDTLALVGANGMLDLTDPSINVRNVEMLDLMSDDESTIVVNPEAVMQLSPQGSIGIVAGTGDMLVFIERTDWLMGDPMTEGGQFMRTVVADEAVAEVDAPFVFQNLVQQQDVSNDGEVRTSDALRVINELRTRDFSDPESTRIVDPMSIDWPGVYFDTSGDDAITSLDALQVINEIARQSFSSESEAEAFVPQKSSPSLLESDIDELFGLVDYESHAPALGFETESNIRPLTEIRQEESEDAETDDRKIPSLAETLTDLTVKQM